MTAPESLTREAIQRLTAETEPWLSCDDCFDQVDEVIESLVTGRAPIDVPFLVHLRACAVCSEEAYSLVTLVSADYGVDPARATGRLDALLIDAGLRPR